LLLGTTLSITAFGPVLSAMIVSAVTDPARSEIPVRRRLAVFGALSVSIGPLITALIMVFDLQKAIVGSAIVGVSTSLADTIIISCGFGLFAAYILSGIFSRNDGIRKLLQPIIQWRVGAKWYLIAVFLMPLIIISSYLLLMVTSGEPVADPLSVLSFNPLLCFIDCIILFFFVSLGEEPGWRGGFATPRLLSSYSPLMTGIIVGILWEVWHLQLFAGNFWRFAATIPLAIIITWIYINTRGSLLPVMILHATWDATLSHFFNQPVLGGGVYPQDFFLFALMAIAALIIIYVYRMWEPVSRVDPAPDSTDLPVYVRGKPANERRARVTRYGVVTCIVITGAFLAHACWLNADSVRPMPASLDGATKIIETSPPWLRSMALFQNGTVVAWGNNDYGSSRAPQGLAGVKDIAATWDTSYALKTDGTLVEWGWILPAPDGIGPIRSIPAGSDYIVALLENGSVVAWGRSRNMDYCSMVCDVPAGIGPVKTIASGAQHVLALRENGSVVAWGGNRSGECNITPGIGPVKAIAAGESHSLAILENGSVMAWGSNNDGQCNVTPGAGPARAIAAGLSHSLVLHENGSVFAFGGNNNGQCNVPPGLTGVKAVAALNFASYAMLENGTVVCWGKP
jgi:membrane protease YdiL (CAAX protease family)